MAGYPQPYTKQFGQTNEDVGPALGGSALTLLDADSFLYQPHKTVIADELYGHSWRNQTLVRPSALSVYVYSNTDAAVETCDERSPYTQILFSEERYSQHYARYEIREEIAFSDLEALSKSRECVLFLALSRPTWPEWSEFTTDIEKSVLNRLYFQYREEAALRLNKLIEIIAENPDDDDVLLSESLRYAANFLIEYQPPYSPFGTIVAGNDGVVSIEWRLPMTLPPDERWKNCDGILSMRFLPSGKITFVGETRVVGDENPFFEIGEEPHNIAYGQVAPFFNGLRMLDDLP